jgi:hypothetical protein
MMVMLASCSFTAFSLRAAPRLNFGCTNPSPEGDIQIWVRFNKRPAQALNEAGGDTTGLVSPHNTGEHLRLSAARVDWVMSPSPGDALVCCVKKCGASDFMG